MKRSQFIMREFNLFFEKKLRESKVKALWIKEKKNAWFLAFSKFKMLSLSSIINYELSLSSIINSDFLKKGKEKKFFLSI